MIILITCMEKRGEIIARLLSERMEMHLENCMGLTGAEVERQMQELTLQYASSIILTDQSLHSENGQMLQIYLHSEETENDAEDGGIPVKAPVIRYDMGLEISGLSNRACAEAIFQFIAIRRMQRLGRRED